MTDTEVAGIVADIDRQGYGTLSNYVTEQELGPVRDLALSAVEAAGGEYVCFTGTTDLTGTVLADLPQSAAFKTLCRRIYELGTGKPAPEVDFYQILRCLKGSSGQSHSYLFHYDSYVLTALLPVAIPKEGLRGDLLVFPNVRPIRRLYLANLLDKIIVDNKLARIFLRLAAHKKLAKVVSIKMQPGNMYFFWGYRSIHTNQPCDADKLRATALFHYGDPHEDSHLRALVRRTRQKSPSKLAA